MLSTTADILTTLIVKYKAFRTSFNLRQDASNATTFENDPVLTGLEERGKDIILYQNQVDSLRAKVMGSSQLVRFNLYF